MSADELDAEGVNTPGSSKSDADGGRSSSGGSLQRRHLPSRRARPASLKHAQNGGKRRNCKKDAYPTDLEALQQVFDTQRSAGEVDSAREFLFKVMLQQETPEEAALAVLQRPDIFGDITDVFHDVSAVVGDCEDFPGLTLLHAAALTGRVNVMRILLTRKADVFAATHPHMRLPIHLALSAEDVASEETMLDMVKLLAGAH